MKMYQQRSYVIAVENAQNVGGMYIDAAEGGLSFRNCKDLLFIGGAEHRTGKQSTAWNELRDFARKNYPGSNEKYHWATQDCMTLDGAPYIGNYSSATPDMYVATGFNKWGMTSAMVAAQILEQVVQGIRRVQVWVSPEADSGTADFLDQIENFFAFLFPDDIAEHASKHADVFFFRSFL